MLNKESKIRVLENFYAVDYTLFGKPVSKVDICCAETIKEYLSVKGAMLSVIVEMYKLVEHAPDVINEKVTSKHIKKFAVKSAKIARENSQKLISSDKGKRDIKNELREYIIKEGSDDVETLIENKIQEKTFSLAIDNLLIARVVNEAKEFKNLNRMEGKILEDAYKILRDSLVELSIFIDEYASIKK